MLTDELTRHTIVCQPFYRCDDDLCFVSILRAIILLLQTRGDIHNRNLFSRHDFIVFLQRLNQPFQKHIHKTKLFREPKRKVARW